MENQTPQTNVHAYIIDRGRAWIETVDKKLQTAVIRFDCNEGRRSRCYTVNLSQVDYTREWRF